VVTLLAAVPRSCSTAYYTIVGRRNNSTTCQGIDWTTKPALARLLAAAPRVPRVVSEPFGPLRLHYERSSYPDALLTRAAGFARTTIPALMEKPG
jgi:hypothetical protein